MIETYSAPQKQHLLTIGLEDYFHVRTFDQVIRRERWDRFETRFEQSTIRVLDLLDRFRVRATFFVLGWIADRQPDLVREVARRGHEIACRSYYNSGLEQRMTPGDFMDDLARSRDAVERASGARVIGFRTTHEWPAEYDLRALEKLADEGYAYHFCIVPILRSFRLEAWRRFACQHEFTTPTTSKSIWEIPISTYSLLGWRIPIAGGNYIRQLPHPLVKRALNHWVHTYDAPLVMYFRTWELDPGQPRISAASHLAKFRHYRNLDKMSLILEDYFTSYRFVGVAEHFGFTARARALAPELERNALAALDGGPRREWSAPLAGGEEFNRRPSGRIPVGVIVPCYNEESTLPYLANTLSSMIAALENQYELHFIFIDDGSSDGTWGLLREIFGSWPYCRLVRHAHNRGVAAAIMTGIRQARTPIVCSIDCDCSYDPQELRNMIPRLTAGVDLVTASPYHPQGQVLNVPAWRLALSKASSFLYRRVLRQKLFTYTSCFRVYRRSAVAGLDLQEDGFLGVAEMLGRMDLNRARIVEHPAILEVRLFGQSKMAVLRTIMGHLWLLARLLTLRLRRDRKERILSQAPPARIWPDAPTQSKM